MINEKEESYKFQESCCGGVQGTVSINSTAKVPEKENDLGEVRILTNQIQSLVAEITTLTDSAGHRAFGGLPIQGGGQENKPLRDGEVGKLVDQHEALVEHLVNLRSLTEAFHRMLFNLI